MRKAFRIVLWAAAAVILCFILLFINAVFGNPISRMLARNGAEEHLRTQYSNTDYGVETVSYNFKDGYYHARIKSPTSIDGDFSVCLDFLGRVRSDTYDDVTSGWNTYLRLENKYRALVDTVIGREDFPLESDIDFGSLMIFDSQSGWEGDPEKNYGIVIEELILNHEYDIRELGRTAGYIVYYAYDEDVTVERAAEMMLLLKDRLDEGNVPFYAMDFVLREPKSEDGSFSPDKESIHVEDFRYGDIYPEGLTGRVQAAHEALTARYAELDAQKQAEIAA